MKQWITDKVIATKVYIVAVPAIGFALWLLIKLIICFTMGICIL